MSPSTEAGRRLLDEEWDNFDAKPWGSMADHVDAIEAEARAALLAELEAGAREVVGAVIDRWYHLGLIRFSSRDDGSDDLLIRDEIVRAVLDLIRKAGKR